MDNIGLNSYRIDIDDLFLRIRRRLCKKIKFLKYISNNGILIISDFFCGFGVFNAVYDNAYITIKIKHNNEGEIEAIGNIKMFSNYILKQNIVIFKTVWCEIKNEWIDWSIMPIFTNK